MNIYAIPPLVSSLLFFGLGIYVWLNNKKMPANKAFFYVSLATSWWQASWYVLFSTGDRALVDILVRVGYSGILFIPSAFYHFFIEFLRREKDRYSVFFAYIISSLFLVLLWSTNYIVNGVYHYNWGYYPRAGSLHPIYLAFLSLICIRALWLLISYLGSKTRSMKDINRARYVLFALIAYIPASSDFLVNYGVGFYPLGFIAIMVAFGMISFAIIRHQLMDIEVLIKKTLLFAGIFGVLILAVSVIFAVMQQLAGEALGINRMMVSAISILLAMLLYEPAKKYLAKITDRFLFQDEHGVFKALKHLAKEVVAILEIEKLTETILTVIRSALRPESGGLLIQTDEGHFKMLDSFGMEACPIRELDRRTVFVQFFKDRNDVLWLEDVYAGGEIPSTIIETANRMSAKVIIPLHYGQLIGFLILGKKKSDQLYTAQELDYFPVFASEIALALKNAQLYDMLRKNQYEIMHQARMASLGLVAASINHEIKNPLYIIKGIIEDKMAAAENACAEATADKDVWSRLLKLTERIFLVIQNLQRFVRTEQPALQKSEIADVKQTIAIVLPLVEVEFKTKQIEIRQNMDNDLPLIQGSRVLLEGILLNLIVNACQAVAPQSGKVEIKGFVQNGKVIIEIEDNGVGISEEKQKQLFQPFFTTKKETGTGLGLYISKQFIERMGGAIYVEAQPERGTTFTIEFIPAVTNGENVK